MRSILFIFSFGFISVAFCQDTIQISLSFSGTLFNHGEIHLACEDRLVFEQPSDSLFLSITTINDVDFMEFNGCADIYFLKQNAPNGFYKIYIDSVLYETFLLSENQRIGLTTHYVFSFFDFSKVGNARKSGLRNWTHKKEPFRLEFYTTETSIIDGATKRNIKKWYTTIDGLSISEVTDKKKSKSEIREIISNQLSQEQHEELINELFL